MAHVARLLKRKIMLRNRKIKRRDFGPNHEYKVQFEAATTSDTKGETDTGVKRCAWANTLQAISSMSDPGTLQDREPQPDVQSSYVHLGEPCSDPAKTKCILGSE